MAEACPGTSLAKLWWLVAWHIRDETYRKALAELVNFQHQIPFAAHWGEGTTSSSDGQRYRAGGREEAAAEINARYGSDPSVTFYTHISDQYAPFHTKVINVTVRDATHVLDGLLYHESDLRIEEHYTDTSGFTDDHEFSIRAERRAVRAEYRGINGPLMAEGRIAENNGIYSGKLHPGRKTRHLQKTLARIPFVICDALNSQRESGSISFVHAISTFRISVADGKFEAGVRCLSVS